MSVVETIKERKSVRSYTGELISTDLIDNIRGYIKQLSAPFGAKARVELVGASMGENPVKLGTYGVISGANHFLALVLKDEPMDTIGGGYIFEQAILYCTKLELGTCWLGATFKQSDFLSQIQLKDGERLSIISPIGYKREKRRLLDSIIRAGAGSDNRKPFESLFFNDNFENPLSRNEAKKYSTPLEMVRLAPSASNKQPWRIVEQDNHFHFYHQPNHFSLNDIGIALCHFELTCKELNLKGSFKILENTPSSEKYKYVISWIAEYY